MPSYYDLTVSLQDVLPRPWRRVLVRTSVTFAALHAVIQDACGWTNSHLYQFMAAGAYDHEAVAAPDGQPDELSGRPVPAAGRVRLTRYFGIAGEVRRTSCVYLYDFGDDWTHDVQLNAVLERSDRFERRLVGGEYAFPPDDCGGPGGYAALQHALRTGRDPDGLIEWARGVNGWTGTYDESTTRRRVDR